MPEYRARHPPKMEPAHPGEILREDVLPTRLLAAPGVGSQAEHKEPVVLSALGKAVRRDSGRAGESGLLGGWRERLHGGSSSAGAALLHGVRSVCKRRAR